MRLECEEKVAAEMSFLARQQRARFERKRRPPWWIRWGWLQGRIYRPVMKVMHRFGWCYPKPTAVEPGFVWCHWCGMRGRR